MDTQVRYVFGPGKQMSLGGAPSLLPEAGRIGHSMCGDVQRLAPVLRGSNTCTYLLVHALDLRFWDAVICQIDEADLIICHAHQCREVSHRRAGCTSLKPFAIACAVSSFSSTDVAALNLP